MEMRPEPNKEIDLLLRQLRRRNGAPVSEADEQHLDADELNSYVANALPEAARARYTEHLADCSSCRKLVAQLSASQGPIAVPESTSVVAPSGWKSFLAGQFSPMVLRYAVPALGLILIAVFGIVVLRQEPQRSSVAQLADTDRSESINATRPAQEATASAEVLNDDSSPAAKVNAQRPAAVAPVKKEDAVVSGKRAEPVGGIGAAPPPAAPKAAVSAEQAPAPSTDLQKQKKAEPAAQPTGVADSAKDRTAETEKREYQSETATVTASPGRVDLRTLELRSAKRAENTAAGAGQDVKRPAKPGETDAAAETRLVAGRRFRKSDGGWIDMDYNSSHSITNVVRGSEQYRALVADEPAIRTIAEDLDGVVIVVWKGRTYRIR